MAKVGQARSILITTGLHIEPALDISVIPLDLLTLADPSAARIESYLRAGKCYIAKLRTEIVGVVVLQQLDATSMEIKNIAVQKREQVKGFGKALLKFSEKVSRDIGCKKLIIGTGNSSVGQLALYQKAGFEIESIKKNYFLKNYLEPIFENGIQCKHMIVLVKKLKE